MTPAERLDVIEEGARELRGDEQAPAVRALALMVTTLIDIAREQNDRLTVLEPCQGTWGGPHEWRPADTGLKCKTCPAVRR